jgi:hypothetical protein
MREYELKDLSFGANELITASLVSPRTVTSLFWTAKPKRSLTDCEDVGAVVVAVAVVDAGAVAAAPEAVAGAALGVSDDRLTPSRSRKASTPTTAPARTMMITTAYTTARLTAESCHASADGPLQNIAPS